MTTKDFAKDGRCKDCEYAAVMSAGNWSFVACKHEPYKSKWVAEIKDCPKGGIGMKYKPEEYIDSGFYDGDMDVTIENPKAKVVKCRKPHQCMGGCDSEIKAGEHALLETGFMDGKPVSCYTCLPCIDEWLDELNEVEGDKSC